MAICSRLVFSRVKSAMNNLRGGGRVRRDVTTSPPQIVNTYKSKGIEARMSRAIAALSGAGGPINKPDKAL